MSTHLDPERSGSGPVVVQDPALSVLPAVGRGAKATALMPPERFELPTPWCEARCSDSAELRRRVRAAIACVAPGAGWWSTACAPGACTSDRRTRPAGLAPASFRPTTGCSAVELWPQGGAPAARRDSGCAEQWESRDPLPIAPCHAGRRRSTCCNYVRSSQTIGCQTALPFASTRPAST